MKTFLAIVSALALLACSVTAQQIQGPITLNAITNQGTWEIRPADGGGAATNVPTTQARWVTVGKDGFGVAVKSYATNAALTTNVWFVLEFGHVDSTGVYPATNNNVTVVVLPRGTATNVYYTNFTANTATYGNIGAVRIKNVMQTNGVIGGSLAGTLFVEKFHITGR